MHSSVFTQTFYPTPALAVDAVTTQISQHYPRLELQGATKQAESPRSWSTTSQCEPIFLRGAELASALHGLNTQCTHAACSSSTSMKQHPKSLPEMALGIFLRLQQSSQKAELVQQQHYGRTNWWLKAEEEHDC